MKSAPIQDFIVLETPVPSSFSEQFRRGEFSHWEIVASGQYYHPEKRGTIYWIHLVRRSSGEASKSKPHR